MTTVNDLERKSTIGARIFRRNQDNLILLWNSRDLTDEQKASSVISVKDKMGLFRPLIVQLTSASEEFDIKKDAVIAIINHKENNLDPDCFYLIRIVLGTVQVLESYLKISPVGVLPDLEKDSRKQHQQLFGWYSKKRRWAKIGVVELEDGSFAIQTVSTTQRVKFTKEKE